jgi:rhodanese-related sulfurtransferase
LAAGCSTGTDATAEGGGPQQNTAAATVQHLDAASFAAAIARPGTVLLDVRTPAEFTTGHLPGAVNLDMQTADFTTRLDTLNQASSYALYCRSGHRSAIAADQMRTAGFGKVVDLAGGITAWTTAGHDLTTG